MGYTHYWYRPEEIKRDKFELLVKDAKEIIKFCEEQGIKIENGLADGPPVLNSDEISINGSDLQPIGIWTTSEEVSIPWPANKTRDRKGLEDPTAGTWFAGTLLQSRVAPIGNLGLGLGSYETFRVSRIFDDDFRSEENGLLFDCCKTAFRPYDLAVTAILVSLKHHVPECRISSDGDLSNWSDAIRMCVELFNYGENFEL